MSRKILVSSLALTALGALSSGSFLNTVKLPNIFSGVSSLFSSSSSVGKDLKQEEKVQVQEAPQKIVQQESPKTISTQESVEVISPSTVQESVVARQTTSSETHAPAQAPITAPKPTETIQPLYGGGEGLDSGSGSKGLGVTCASPSGVWWVREVKDCGFW